MESEIYTGHMKSRKGFQQTELREEQVDDPSNKHPV